MTTVPETRYAKSGGLNIAFQVVGVAVLAVVWMVYRRLTQKSRADARRYGPGEEATLTPETEPDRPGA